ncbi:MAG: class I SAM-dependent methyltransferase [Thermoleophilia bacterium]
MAHLGSRIGRRIARSLKGASAYSRLKSLEEGLRITRQAVGLTASIEHLPPRLTVPFEPVAIDGVSGSLDRGYALFERLYYGTPDEIQERQRPYLRYFESLPDVLSGRAVVDLGCGRGEFLSLLRDRGIRAVGVEPNSEQTEGLTAQGFEILNTDANSFLAEAPDGSLAGAVALQVIEHLDPAYLLNLLRFATGAIAPGGLMIIETINPANPVARGSFFLDVTHVRPYHAEALAVYLWALGWKRQDVVYSLPSSDKGAIRTPMESNYMHYALVLHR